MNMNNSILRLTYAFLGLFIVISLVLVSIQVFQAPQLQASGYNPRHCIASSEPVRGSIYDRNGVKLVWSVQDPNAPCGWRRVWNPDAVAAGLGPLIGYFSYRYGASGIEATYNDLLSGTGGANSAQTIGQQLHNVYSQLLHRPVVGNDIYLTIDLKLQEQVNAVYNLDAITGGVCQPPGSDPAGSITVEDPNTGEILAMVSRPFFDPNQINNDSYWNQITNSPDAPLINRAAQGVYDPGSTFKTLTLAAGIDSGQYQLNSPFTLDKDSPSDIDQDLGQGGDRDNDQDQDQALYFTVPGGETIAWDDYFPKAGSNGWVGIASPVTLQDGYAYSDNVIYARVAYHLGANTWLDAVRKFGIATPGTPVNAVPFDGSPDKNPSRAYTPGANFDGNLLAESGFGQGQLLISPLTMTEITSTMASGGNLFVPHTLYKAVPPGQNPNDSQPQPSEIFGGAPTVQPSTAAAVREAMRGVVTYGTGYHTISSIASAADQEGGKSGTAQLGSGLPHTWWLSMAPATAGANAQLVVVVMKEHSGEGACQMAVAHDVYKCANGDSELHLSLGDIGPCPVGVKQP